MARNITMLMLLLCCYASCNGQDIRVHDPVMAKHGDTYYLFCTGMGISMFSSKDLKTWKKEPSVFKSPPKWAVESVPGFKGHIWAPDISFHNGQYFLYYSVSAFGKNTSCIGVVTNKTLDQSSPDYQWIDHGKVVQSVPGRDLWNAIDPNLTIDDESTPWLAFGSFWGGMKLVRMDQNLKRIAEPQEWYTISKRQRDYKTDDDKAGEAAVEAPFIFRKNGFYYLFVSFDVCCRGVNSNYKVMTGRSRDIRGPYYDQDSVRMDHGGGTLVVAGDSRWPGVGHNAVYTFGEIDYLVFHAYDAAEDGKPKLKVRPIIWSSNGWPVCTLE